MLRQVAQSTLVRLPSQAEGAVDPLCVLIDSPSLPSAWRRSLAMPFTSVHAAARFHYARSAAVPRPRVPPLAPSPQTMAMTHRLKFWWQSNNLKREFQVGRPSSKSSVAPRETHVKHDCQNFTRKDNCV